MGQLLYGLRGGVERHPDTSTLKGGPLWYCGQGVFTQNLVLARVTFPED